MGTFIFGVLLLMLIAAIAWLIFAIKNKKRKRGPAGAILGIFVFMCIEAPTVPPTPDAKERPPIARVTPKPATFPKYLQLFNNQKVLLDSNNEGNGKSGTLFDDLQTTKAWAMGQVSSPSEIPHHDLPVGTELEVESWQKIPSVGDSNGMMTVVRVHTLLYPQVAGYLRDIYVLPKIPKGSILVKDMYNDKRADIPNGTKVKFIREAPGEVAAYYGEIQNGPKKGKKKWFSFMDLKAPSPKVSGAEYDESCHCVSLFMADARS